MTEKTKRQKLVFSNHELAHVWATQTQDNGRNSGYSFYFEKDTIYSYGCHFPIARFVTPDIVLFNSDRYGSTTSQHQSHVRGSVQHKIVYEVPFISQGHGHGHEKNLNYFKDKISKYKEKSLRAVKYSAGYHGYAMGYLETLKKYRSHFQRYLTPNRKRYWLRFIKTPIYNETERVKLEGKTARSKELEVLRQARWEKENAKLLREYGEKVVLWIAGDDVRLPYVQSISKLCYLRIKDEQVETTWGAVVPIVGARKLYRAIQAGINVIGQKIGYYTVSSLTDDTLIVGCHRIPIAEIHRIGQHL